MNRHLLYTSIITKRAHIVELDDLNGRRAYELLAQKEGISEDQFTLSVNGRTIRNSEHCVIGDHHDIISVQMSIPVLGGKGGFGSMLRAIGAQIEKTTNKEACRDLSGRRLRDVNAEKKIKNWISKQAERKKEEEQKRKDKLEKLVQEPKIVFQDEEYFKTKSEIPEAVESAVSQGLKKVLKKSDTSATATTSSSLPPEKTVVSESQSKITQKRKEPPSDTSGQKKKLKGLWLGVDVVESEDEDDDGEVKLST